MTEPVDSEVIDTVRTTVIIDDEDFNDGTATEAGLCGVSGLGGPIPCAENSGGNDMIPGCIGCSAMQEA